jgi:hypothetical protein
MCVQNWRIFNIKADGMYSYHCGLSVTLQCTESAPITEITLCKQSLLSGCYVHKCSFLQYTSHSYLSILLLLFSFYFHVTKCFCYVIIYLVTDIFQFMSLNRNAFFAVYRRKQLYSSSQFRGLHQSLCLETYCALFPVRKLILTLTVPPAEFKR